MRYNIRMPGLSKKRMIEATLCRLARLYLLPYQRHIRLSLFKATKLSCIGSGTARSGREKETAGCDCRHQHDRIFKKSPAIVYSHGDPDTDVLLIIRLKTTALRWADAV